MVRRGPDPVRFAAQAERLTTLLGLATPPVAVCFAETIPDGVPQAAATLKGCMFLDEARFHGEVFWADAGNLGACPGGRHYLGLGPAFAKLTEGTWPAADVPEGIAVFGNPEAFRATFPHYAVVPQAGMQGLGFAPLGLSPFGPEHGRNVVVIFCSPKAAMYLARCVTYESGGLVDGPVGPPTCSMVMSRPVLTGQAVYTLGCYGFRHYVRIGGDEVVFGLPLEKLDEAVAGLERFFARRPDIAGMLMDDTVREADIAKVHAGTDRLRAWYRQEIEERPNP